MHAPSGTMKRLPPLLLLVLLLGAPTRSSATPSPVRRPPEAGKRTTTGTPPGRPLQGRWSMWRQVRRVRKDTRALLDRNRTSLANLSTTSLLISPASGLLEVTRGLGPVLGPFTGIGSVGLGVVSTRDLLRAKTSEHRVDAAHGILWSLQGLAGFGLALQRQASWIAPAARTLGVAGGALQVSIGAHRLATGLRRRDRERVVLGSLDVGAGTCWALSTCSLLTPWTTAGFVTFTLARLGYTAYQRRDALGRGALKLRGRLQRGSRALSQGLRRAAAPLTGPWRRPRKHPGPAGPSRVTAGP